MILQFADLAPFEKDIAVAIIVATAFNLLWLTVLHAVLFHLRAKVKRQVQEKLNFKGDCSAAICKIREILNAHDNTAPIE